MKYGHDLIYALIDEGLCSGSGCSNNGGEIVIHDSVVCHLCQCVCRRSADNMVLCLTKG